MIYLAILAVALICLAAANNENTSYAGKTEERLLLKVLLYPFVRS